MDLSLKEGFYEDSRETLSHDIQRMLDLFFVCVVNNVTGQLLKPAPSQALSVVRECLESDYKSGLKVMERLFGGALAKMYA